MAEEPRPGLIVGGRYELIEIAGRGGMADVWRGRVRGDWGFVRDVAVKQMHQNLASQPPYVAMFVEEARSARSLQSPNVAEVHDFVHDRGNYYMILEWIDGIDLGTWIRWHVAQQRADAVGAGRGGRRRNSARSGRGARAHRTRRRADARSSIATCRRTTCCSRTRGMVKLIDFGLALAPDRAQETTEPGIVKGKMSYLAPEIVAGGRPIPASRISSRAARCCGRRSSVASCSTARPTTRRTRRLRDCMVQPLRPLRPDVPAPFAQIIQRALAANVDQRFPSTREMARQIGTTLKKVQLRKDLHTVLSKAVADARTGMGLGPRTGDPSSATPVAQIVADDTPRIELAPQRRDAARRQPISAMEKLRGLPSPIAVVLRAKARLACAAWWALALVTAACGDNTPPPFVPLSSGAAELTSPSTRWSSRATGKRS